MLMALGVFLLGVVLFEVLTGGKSKTGKGVSQIVKETAGKLTGLVSGSSANGTGASSPSEIMDGSNSSWGLRDPFSKPEFENQPGKAGAGDAITVKGVVWMGGKPYVLINDMILTQGEEKNGYRVERIEGRKVFIRKRGKMMTLLWSKSP
jgi:hypothetical protein